MSNHSDDYDMQANGQTDWQTGRHEEPLMNKGLREQLRDFLIELEVYGDERGLMEYTDSGVWPTDKAIDQILALVGKQLLQRISEVGMNTYNSHDYQDGMEKVKAELHKSIQELMEGSDE